MSFSDTFANIISHSTESTPAFISNLGDIQMVMEENEKTRFLVWVNGADVYVLDIVNNNPVRFNSHIDALRFIAGAVFFNV